MSAPRITIRRATPGDLPAANALESATFTAHAISPRQMRYLQGSPRAIFLVALMKRQLVGDAIALVRANPTGSLSGRIYSVVVDPAHRGRKIGRKLTVALLRELDTLGVGRTTLEVDHANAAAIHLYEQLGFRTFGKRSHYYGRGRHAFKMIRGL